MCYTTARRIAEGLALPAQVNRGLPLGLPPQLPLPPRGHGRGVPLLDPPVRGPGLTLRWVNAIIAFNRGGPTGRSTNPAVLLENMRRHIGRSRN